MQDKSSAKLLKNQGIENITIAGDTRFDRVFENAQRVSDNLVIEKFVANHRVFVVGSAWQTDMDVLIPFINANPSIKFIVVPHEIDYEKIEDWSKEIKLNSAKYLEIQKNINSENHKINTNQVIFIDTIGLLSNIYKYADYVFIGGGFDKGLHNILEAAVFGPPIFFGNKAYKKFKEALDLIDLQVAYPIETLEDLTTIFDKISKSPQEIARIKTTSEQFVQANLGATNKILKYLQD